MVKIVRNFFFCYRKLSKAAPWQNNNYNYNNKSHCYVSNSIININIIVNDNYKII